MLKAVVTLNAAWLLVALVALGCVGDGAETSPAPTVGVDGVETSPAPTLGGDGVETSPLAATGNIESYTPGTEGIDTVIATTVIESIGTADYAPIYESLEDMTRVYSVIIVGRVTDTLLPFDPRPGFLGLTPEQLEAIQSGPKASTPSEEELARPPGRGFSVYAIEVLSVISADEVREGDVIGVLQSGGTFEGTAYQTEGDPVLGLGSAFVLFLQEYRGLQEISEPEPWGITYSGAPYGRFVEGTGGKLAVIDQQWACIPCEGPRAIIGQTLDSAAERIIAASLGKLGDVELAPPYAPTPRPTPRTPGPTPAIEIVDGQPTLVPQGFSEAAPTPTPSP